MIHKVFLAVCVLSFLLIACDDGPPKTEKPATTAAQPAAPTSSAGSSGSNEINVQDTILKQLQSYYRDLAAKKLQEDKYFSPILLRYYSQENKTREEVGAMIRRAFEGIERREITINPTSLNISQLGDDHEVRFSGSVKVRRTGETADQTEDFHNRFVFDKNFRIKVYDKDADVKSPQTQRNSQNSLDPQAIQEIMASYSHADGIQESEAPDAGIYYMKRSGAFEKGYHYDNPAQLMEDHPEVKTLLGEMSCEMKTAALPLFDCDGFSKEGCFLDKISDYSRLSEVFKAMDEYDIEKVSPSEISTAQAAEKLITCQLTHTADGIALLFGKVEGKWELIAIDASVFDCSA